MQILIKKCYFNTEQKNLFHNLNLFFFFLLEYNVLYQNLWNQ